LFFKSIGESIGDNLFLMFFSRNLSTTSWEVLLLGPNL
jgi:hypothetical protein